MLLALKIACLLCGVGLIAFVLLSYEDEEKAVRAWVQSGWLRLESAEKRVGSGLVRGLALVSAAAEGVLVRIYGSSLFSVRAFLVPLVWSAAVVGLRMSFTFFTILIDASDISWLWPAAFFAVVSLLTLCGPWIKSAWGLPLLALPWVAGFLGLLPYGPVKEGLVMAVSVLAGICLDAGIVALSRVGLRRAALSGSLGKALANLALVLPGLFLFWCAVYVVETTPRQLLIRESEGDLRPTILGVFVSGVLTPMWVAQITGALLIAIFSVALMGRALFTVAPRLLYALEKFKLFENRKSLLIAGGLFISVWTPDFGQFAMDKLPKLVGG